MVFVRKEKVSVTFITRVGSRPFKMNQLSDKKIQLSFVAQMEPYLLRWQLIKDSSFNHKENYQCIYLKNNFAQLYFK